MRKHVGFSGPALRAILNGLIRKPQRDNDFKGSVLRNTRVSYPFSADFINCEMEGDGDA